MARRFISHGRHHFVAYIALFFALTGSAVAAKPMLTGADIQDGTITSDDIARDFSPGAITKDNIAQDTLTGGDILESTLGTVPIATLASRAFTAAQADDSGLLDGKDSSDFLTAGAKADDAELLDGKDSSEFLTKNLVWRYNDFLFTSSGSTTNEVNCSPGELAYGGAADLFRTDTGQHVSGGQLFYSAPITVTNADGALEAHGWRAAMANNTTLTQTFRVMVLCASP